MWISSDTEQGKEKILEDMRGTMRRGLRNASEAVVSCFALEMFQTIEGRVFDGKSFLANVQDEPRARSERTEP